MAFDGVTLAFIKNEIEKNALGLRVDKIYNPTKEEIILVLGGKNNKQLFLSASSQARVYFTEEKLENPMQPPMFCMLLRKHLISSRICGVRQHNMDRILFLDFNTRDSFGDMVVLTLAIEIMGRHSNIILIGPDGNVIDSVKRIGLETSSVRQILPGIRYYLPPEQEKINILDENSVNKIILKIEKTDEYLYKVLMAEIMGLSPVISKEICFSVFNNTNIKIDDLSHDDFLKLEKYLDSFKNNIKNDQPMPSIAYDDGVPYDYSAVYLSQFNESKEVEKFSELSKMIELFYTEKYRIERVKSRSFDILRLLNTNINRTKKKIEKQKIELENSKKGQIYQKYGDLISANMYSIEKNAKSATVIDLYSDEQEMIEIPLDSRQSPAQNAQVFYKRYKKSGVAQIMLKKLIEEAKHEFEYLETVLDTVYRSMNEQELELIRLELIESGYIKKAAKAGSVKKIDPYNYFLSRDGVKIISGKNNIANDKLTLKTAAKDDIWLHAKEIPGSHVVIKKEGIKDLSQETIVEGAKIAAFHSKARDSSNVAVDYTEIRNVKKQKGGKPGMVIYDNFKTLFVTPKKEEIENMTQDNAKGE